MRFRRLVPATILPELHQIRAHARSVPDFHSWMLRRCRPQSAPVATILCYMDALVVATSALHLVERPHTHLNLNILTVRVLHDCCAAVQLRL